MKKKIILSLKMMSRLECGRVQLFNRQIYRIYNGKAFRQMITYENGQQKFIDFGSEVDITKIYNQIKLVFNPDGEIVAVRPTGKESLVATKKSIWQKSLVPKKKTMSEELRNYHQQELREYHNWTKKESMYCYQKYSKNAEI